jgi:hypothetical protein
MAAINPAQAAIFIQIKTRPKKSVDFRLFGCFLFSAIIVKDEP